MRLKESIVGNVADIACVALEVFTQLIPFAAGHDIAPQNRRGLHRVRMPA